MNTAASSVVEKDSERKSVKSHEFLRQSRTNELFIAVVGPAGSGVGTAASVLKGFLESETVDGVAYDVRIIKASDEIKAWARTVGKSVPPAGRKTLAGMIQMQDLGDDMRSSSKDNAAVARAVIGKIREVRAEASGKAAGELDGKPRAYLIDSLRHPAEAHLLRRVYQDAFSLLGIVCDPDIRETRLRKNLFEFKEQKLDDTRMAVAEFIDRDADAPDKHGQHVTDTFQEADFFVDNSINTEDIANTNMNEPLRRFVNLITSARIVRPSLAETAMHHAHSAQLSSACLSRQVGAALVDGKGNIIATGANEVPKAGGGVYGRNFDNVQIEDQRCAFRETRYCSSNVEQNEIIDDLIERFPTIIDGNDREVVKGGLRKTRIGGLIEFSRAVHAEMDAILSAARIGVSPQGARLYVSTFPCHYCARHIVSAGIDEVQYIEPYPKSRALKLHYDSISTDPQGWVPPSRMKEFFESDSSKTEAPRPDPAKAKVLFRPFVGVAPRMYRKVFIKDRDYKNKDTGNFNMGEPDWGSPSDVYAIRYTELEAELGAVSA